jgi:mannose-1-phosphate guanylyltransferase
MTLNELSLTRLMDSSRPEDGKPSRWAIVLAGGEGHRLQSFIEEWLGENRPKQYCSLVDSRSLLQTALDRIEPVVEPERIITVIGPGQREFLEESVLPGSRVNVIEQPASRGTASAVYTALAHIRLHDPGAVVLVVPCDHHIHPEEVFVEHLERALAFTDKKPNAVVCLGAVPSYPETEYGWIEPANQWEGGLPDPLSILPVLRFVEKPSLPVAESLLTAGCFWNTLVVAGRAATLWNLGLKLAPSLMSHVDLYLAALEAVRGGILPEAYAEFALQRAYMSYSPLDLSKDILESAGRSLYVLPMTGVEWGDLGRPERLMESLHLAGRSTAVPSSTVGLPLTLQTGIGPSVWFG